MNTLNYTLPPKTWTEALPLGNGVLGAMMFGDDKKERIQLNEDSLWSGGFRERINTLSKNSYKKIRRLISEGNICEAEKLIKETMWTYLPHMTHYQSAGDIWIDFLNTKKSEIVIEKDEMGIPRTKEVASNPEKYLRTLNLSTGIWKVKYGEGKNKVKANSFISMEDNVLVYRMEGNHISCIISYTRKDLGRGKCSSYIDRVYTRNNSMIIAEGVNGGINGIRFTVGIKVDCLGGKVKSNGSALIITDAKELVLYMTIRTSFRSENPLRYCIKQLEKKTLSDYSSLLINHKKVFSEQYNRFYISLNNKKEEKNKEYHNEISPSLIELFVNYGKYLLITSSNKNSLPSNLQGIWNEDLAPSWGSKYTLNVNTQMNYSFALQMNMEESYIPLLNHLQRMLPRGKKIAKEMYDLSGFVCHHTTDIWGDCAPQDQNLMATIWPMGGAWLSLFIWKHYEYYRDSDLLEKYYPILEESVMFFNEYLFKDKNGKWVTGPSTSPENEYILNGKITSLSNGPAMDIQIVVDLFTSYLKTVNILNKKSTLELEIKQKLLKLNGITIGSDGRLLEWANEYEEVDKGHRHISHLYALHPSQQISRSDTSLISACKKTLEGRLMHGGGHTSWSLVWIISLWNRIGEPEKAKKNLKQLLKDSYNNLFTKHPPFQIDGNFGGVEAILQFFIQEEEEKLLLLPSLPESLSTGIIRGYRTKFGVMINMEWIEGKIVYLEFIPIINTLINYDVYEGQNIYTKKVHLIKGENKVIVKKGDS